MSRRAPPLAVARTPLAVALAVLVGALGAPRTARGADADEAAALGAPETARDARVVRRAALDALEAAPGDDAALRALLVAARRLEDADALDDALERLAAREAAGGVPPALACEGGRARLRRARLEDPPDPAGLRDAAARLAAALDRGGPGLASVALDLAHARHLLGDVDGALAAYERALDGDEPTGELAWRGVESLLARDAARLEAVSAALVARHPGSGPAVRGRAAQVEARAGREGWRVLLEAKGLLETSPRTMLALALRLREADDRHDEALALERRALARAGGDLTVLDGVEAAWRERRPFASVADVEAFTADAEALLAAVGDDPERGLTYRNDLAFRLRDVVASFAWRGEGRTQGLAAGAPPEARRWLDRVVTWYDGAVGCIPADAASHPFPRRWVWAGVLNDAALLRHYWLDVRDLARAEALYLQAFDLTDGAYVDTYHYNLQYLYGLELPGREERWEALARRAARAVLKEVPGGGYEPDEGKREAARRDADALERLRKARTPPR